MDKPIDEKYKFKLLDEDGDLTDENIRNFLNASYNLYIDFPNAKYPDSWFSKNPQWRNEVLEIQTQGWPTPDTKYYKFLKSLFIEIHNFYFMEPPNKNTNFLHENTANKLKFLHQLLQTLEEDNITGVYRVPSNSKLIDYLTCNKKRRNIFEYAVPAYDGKSTDKKYIAISNTQIQALIELKQNNKDTGLSRECEDFFGIYKDLPNPSYQPRPSHKRYHAARQTKRGLSDFGKIYSTPRLSTDDRRSTDATPSRTAKKRRFSSGGKTKKQCKKKLSKKKLFKRKRINKTRKKY
jgi:predicted DNA-binding protein (MmcQ/YjbR family)